VEVTKSRGAKKRQFAYNNKRQNLKKAQEGRKKILEKLINKHWEGKISIWTTMP